MSIFLASQTDILFTLSAMELVGGPIPVPFPHFEVTTFSVLLALILSTKLEAAKTNPFHFFLRKDSRHQELNQVKFILDYFLLAFITSS